MTTTPSVFPTADETYASVVIHLNTIADILQDSVGDGTSGVPPAFDEYIRALAEKSGALAATPVAAALNNIISGALDLAEGALVPHAYAASSDVSSLERVSDDVLRIVISRNLRFFANHPTLITLPDDLTEPFSDNG